jgi:hypothetical protein
MLICETINAAYITQWVYTILVAGAICKFYQIFRKEMSSLLISIPVTASIAISKLQHHYLIYVCVRIIFLASTLLEWRQGAMLLIGAVFGNCRDQPVNVESEVSGDLSAVK